VLGIHGGELAEKLGGSAGYLPTAGEPGVFLFGPDISRTELTEEYLHVKYHRKRNWSYINPRSEQGLIEEIRTQHVLLRFGRRSGWNDAELVRIRAALTKHMRDLEELLSREMK
jgi:hypothetical protein